MTETIKSGYSHGGLIVFRVSLGAADAPVECYEWRIISFDSKPDRYITAATKEDAERLIDSGKAKRALERIRHTSKS